jgi:hypothetical protein
MVAEFKRQEEITIAQALGDDAIALEVLRDAGFKNRFISYRGSPYIKIAALSPDIGNYASIMVRLGENKKALLGTGVQILTSAIDARFFTEKTTSGFARHGKLYIVNPRSALAIAIVQNNCEVSDKIRERFGLVYFSSTKKRSQQLTELLGGVQSEKPPQLAIVPEPAPTPKAAPSRIAFTDASVRPQVEPNGFTTFSAYLPDKKLGVVKVLKMAIPVQNAEAQAAAMAIEQFGDRVNTIYTDNLDNVEYLEILRLEEKDNHELDSQFWVFRSLLKRGITLTHVPREKNAIADHLSKLPTPKWEEGIYYFDVEVVGDDITAIVRPNTPIALPQEQAPKQDDAVRLAIVAKARELAEVKAKAQELAEEMRQVERRAIEIDSEIETLEKALSLIAG